MQWLVPTLLLLVIVITMLFRFSARSSRSVSDSVDGRLAEKAQEYATKVHYELVKMSTAGKPIGYLMKGYISSNKRFMVEMAEALCHNTDAYAVVYYADGEEGLLHDGTRVEVTQMPYFPKIEEAMRGVGEASPEDVAVRYIYVENDGLGTMGEAIIAIVSVDGEEEGDKLLMYYPIGLLRQVFNLDEYDGNNFYAFMDAEGRIMEKTGIQSNFLAKDNFWDAMREDPKLAGEARNQMSRVKNKASGSFRVMVGGEDRTCAYAAVGINNWVVMMGVSHEYVDDIKNAEWENTKNMILKLVVAILVFFVLVIIINVINKIRSGQENRELEQKADTDLLTSLNNKLATERKIKEYMETQPNEQGLLFVLDIDNFKKINDTLGHAFGDEVLRTLGHSIGSIFRATDIIGRTGGDEFTIFLKHLNGDELLEKEAAKLCTFFKDFQAGEYVKYAATASIGAAVFPRDGKDFESLYKAADSALYVAKKRGKNQLAFYGDESTKSEGQKKVEEDSRIRD